MRPPEIRPMQKRYRIARTSKTEIHLHCDRCTKAVTKEIADCIAGHGGAQEPSLQSIAFLFSKPRCLTDCFDAFGRNAHPQPMR